MYFPSLTCSLLYDMTYNTINSKQVGSICGLSHLAHFVAVVSRLQQLLQLLWVDGFHLGREVGDTRLELSYNTVKL